MFNFKSCAHSFNRSRKFIELVVGREKLVIEGKYFEIFLFVYLFWLQRDLRIFGIDHEFKGRVHEI